MKKFLIFIAKTLAVCGAAALILILLNNRYKQVMDNPYSDTHKFEYMDSTFNNIQICNMGSSHGEYGFNYEELTKKQGYECFNFAMASQSYNYDYAVMNMYADHFADHCLMFIPVSYFSFNDEVTNDSERESLSTKYYTFLSPKYIPNYDPYVDIVTYRLPILSAGEDIVKLFPSLSLKVFAAQSGPSPEEFQQKAASRYSRHMDNKEEYFMEERINNLYDILQFCKDNGITPVLISTPYTSYYSDLFSSEYKEEFYQTVAAIAENTQTPYYDYSEDERFRENLEYFADADHLNTDGSAYFMDIIENEIPEFSQFLQNIQPNHAGDSNWVPEI